MECGRDTPHSVIVSAEELVKLAGHGGGTGAGGGGGGTAGCSSRGKMRSSSRSAFSFPDLRRILLRAARGSPPMGRLCDPEKGIGAGGSSGGAAQVGNSPMLGTAGGATMGSNTKSQTSSSDRHASSHNLHGTPHNHHIKVRRVKHMVN